MPALHHLRIITKLNPKKSKYKSTYKASPNCINHLRLDHQRAGPTQNNLLRQARRSLKTKIKNLFLIENPIQISLQTNIENVFLLKILFKCLCKQKSVFFENPIQMIFESNVSAIIKLSDILYANSHFYRRWYSNV